MQGVVDAHEVPPMEGPAPAAAVEEPSGTTGGLASPAMTEERERRRIEATAGRAAPVALMIRLGLAVAHLGTPLAARNGLRYRPVAWTLIALVALAFFLPGRVDWSPAPEPWAAPSPVAVAPPVTAPPGESPIDVSLPPPVTTPIPPFSGPSPGLPAAPTPQTTVPASPPPTPNEGPRGMPLEVRGYGWASRLPVTPLPVDAVAEGTAPVSNRLGSVERVSFLRLAGDDDTLTLTEHQESAREALGPAHIAICPILEPDWSEEPGQSFEVAPAWDTTSCVAGAENDGTWTFDLSSFVSPGSEPHGALAGDAGFALVPTVDAPADFNVAFTMPTPAAPA